MRYYIIAGEASGDLHGSNLIRGLRAEDPEAVFRFWGGDFMLDAVTNDVDSSTCGAFSAEQGETVASNMKDLSATNVVGSSTFGAFSAEKGETAATEMPAGLVKHYREGAVMGVSDVLAKAGRLMANVRLCKRDIMAWKPDVVILIDYPGFNFKIAEYAHNKGIKVFYYIAPKTWASREGRNRKLRKYVDKLFIVFPFEKPYFDKNCIPYIYKGNPLIDAVDSHGYRRPCEEPYIAVLPGSRKGEISRMMPVCMEVADRLGCKVIVAGAPARSAADYDAYIAGRRNVELVFGRTYDVLKYADAAVINSGTASLEAALIGTPQVVGWSASGLTIFVARRILKVGDHISFISLGNLILGRGAFRELIQKDFSADKVEAEVRRLMTDADCRARMLSDYADIRAALGGAGASRAVAKAMIESLTIS